MSSSKAESPITKGIFLQKIFRFAGRTVKDLVIFNSVCKDFEETMQAHHTFNLVLYDNIIKKRNDEVTYELDDYGEGPMPVTFFHRSVKFLSMKPAWIVYQWTTVNEHDETQRELLKAFLFCQAKNENRVLIRKNVSGEDPSTTRELFCHIIDSYIKLGIAKEALEILSDEGWNCIMHAVTRQIYADSFKLLIESCFHHGVDMKKMLEQNTATQYTCIMIAANPQLPVDSFKLLIESCIRHGVDMKKMLEHQDNSKWTCISFASQNGLNTDSFRFLIAHFPSNKSFLMTLAVEDWLQQSAVDYAKTEEIKAFLEDPDCWKKCREWCTSNGITFEAGRSVPKRAGQESGKRRKRE